MSSPTPPASIEGSCSVIRQNTLYVYSPEAFQSLPLKDGAKWSRLKPGTPVSGATCVQAGDDALWVVGGTSKNSDYAGLQKYSFADGSWESIVPVDNVLKDRQGHSTAYLSDSGMILVYAGSRDDPKQLSQETFAISTQKPYNILSYSGKTPPVVQPILLQWNTTSAITLGGNDDIKDIYIFTPGHGSWRKYPTALTKVPKDSTLERATLVQGTDGSKVLELYDMSVSPNVVTGILLQNSQGQPAITGRIVGPALTTGSKRDLVIGEWPPYNSSAAPTYTRSGFNIAQGQDGLVAITGGNADHPVSLFNEQKNSWVDSSQFFGINGNDQSVFQPSSTVASPTPTLTETPTSTPAPIDSNPHRTSLILGATLGSILGFIALLIIFLLCLRRKSKQKAAKASAEEVEKPRLSFADRGAPFMMEAGGAANTNSNIPTSVYDPHSSMAIMGGMANHKRGMESRGSESSTARLVPGRKSGPGMPDAMEMATIREKNDSPADPSRLQAGSTNGGLMPPKRSSGWSRYFSGNTEILASARTSKSSNRKSDGLRKSAMSRKSTRSSRASSHYAQSVHDCKTHGPTEIPPLKFGEEFESARVNSEVASLPPTTPAKSTASKTRPTTMDSELSSNPPSTLDDTIFAYDASPAHENNQWTPVDTTNPRSEWSRDWSPAAGARQRDTTTSSIYGPVSAAPSGLRDNARGPRQSALVNARLDVGAAPAMQAPAPAATLAPAVYTTPSGNGGGFFTAPVGSAVYPNSRPPTTRTDTSDPYLDARAQGPVFGESNQPRGYDAPAGVGTDINGLAYPAPSAAAKSEPQREVKMPNYQTTPAPYRNSTAARKSISNAAAKPDDLPIQEVTKTSAVSTPEVKHDGHPGSWPTPPQRASIVDMDDLDDSDDDDDGDVVIATASSGPAPTAMTAIPVPGSTAMKYTVKKPAQKPATNNDMGWLNLRG